MAQWRVPATNVARADISVACKQGLRDTPAAWREKEGELATTPLEFEHLHQKSRREMLIGRDDT